MSVEIQPFFDQQTNTFRYVVGDPQSARCAIIDSVLGYDLPSGRTDHKQADRIVHYVRQKKLQVEWILETRLRGLRR